MLLHEMLVKTSTEVRAVRESHQPLVLRALLQRRVDLDLLPKTTSPLSSNVLQRSQKEESHSTTQLQLVARAMQHIRQA